MAHAGYGSRASRSNRSRTSKRLNRLSARTLMATSPPEARVTDFVDYAHSTCTEGRQNLVGAEV
jgi:hypothetical protein